MIVFLPRSFSHSFTSRREIHQIIILISAKMMSPSKTTPPKIEPATIRGSGGCGHTTQNRNGLDTLHVNPTPTTVLYFSSTIIGGRYCYDNQYNIQLLKKTRLEQNLTPRHKTLLDFLKAQRFVEPPQNKVDKSRIFDDYRFRQGWISRRLSPHARRG